MATRRALKTEETPAPTTRRRLPSSESPSDGAFSAQGSASYFASGAEKDLPFVSTGCTLLDEALGGGYVLGRMSNLIGDKSTGKTLLAIEACANFHRDYPDGLIRYAEAEAAFDRSYAEALGLPKNVVAFAEGINTVEDWYGDLVKFIAQCKGKPGVYILDSLDALSDEAEMERDIDKGSYGANKAKKIGELFRKLVRELEKSKILLLIISQIRDKMNVTFGETKTRAGGRAMDFYATHCVWLAQVGKIDKTIGGVKRVYGVRVRANVKKNKVGLPFREAEFPILFGYGVDDLLAGVEWLIDEAKRDDVLEELGVTKAGYKVRLTSLRDKGGEPVREFRKTLSAVVRRVWAEVESGFLPKSSKY